MNMQERQNAKISQVGHPSLHPTAGITLEMHVPEAAADSEW
jgi:hypothetical protein